MHSIWLQKISQTVMKIEKFRNQVTQMNVETICRKSIAHAKDHLPKSQDGGISVILHLQLMPPYLPSACIRYKKDRIKLL